MTVRDYAGAVAVDEIRSPWSGEVVGSAPRSSGEDATRAVGVAVEGAASMRRLTAYQRSELLNRAADLIEADVEGLARTISGEEGKPLSEARGEAGRTPALFRLAASEGARMHGETLPLDASPGAEDKLGFTLRVPCGVVVAITPFNYPLLLVAHKVAPALAAGNAVVLKPASQTPLTSLRLTHLLHEAGVPPEALQTLHGPGAELGEALCSDERVRKISFTGSAEVGRRIAAVAGVKKLSLELGANCPVVVLPDADLELVAQATAAGGFVNAGQVCISVQRVLVDEAIYGDFLDALGPAVESIRVGDPFDEGTQLAALVSEREAERVERTIRGAVEAGAKLVTGGERDRGVVQPAIVADVPEETELWRDELFGPAVAVRRVPGIDAAIALANDTRYGLGAGIFTSDVASAFRFVREVAAGNLHVNWTPLWRADLMPYGGLKGSGIGKEGPRYAIEEMTELKTVVFHGVNGGAW
jgi:acyl-CoA reductase-like NAD-dependent aldehyde dehydrogenase